MKIQSISGYQPDLPINKMLAEKSMKLIFTISMLLITTHVYASWSGFAYITPHTADEYEIDMEFKPSETNPDNFIIKLKADLFRYETLFSKHAWLIVTSDKLSKADQEDFCFAIRDSGYSKKNIQIKTKLMPKCHYLLPDGSPGYKVIPLFYEVELAKSLIEHSYIYIDFPEEVLDGGLRYSIDLGSYLKKYNNTANNH